MKLPNDLKLTLVIDVKISLWQAIKLRIAGKNTRTIVEEVLKDLRNEHAPKDDKKIQPV